MEVFLLCDGNHKVDDIITEFHEKFRLTQTETRAAVQKYLMSLAERHLIGFRIPKKFFDVMDVRPGDAFDLDVDLSKQLFGIRRRKRKTKL